MAGRRPAAIPMTERWRSYIARGVEAAGSGLAFATEQWMALFPVYLAIRRALPAGGRVLDVGCGAGAFTALLAHRGFEAVGIDEDPDVVSCAREMAGDLRAPIRIERAAADDLSVFYDQFDLVYSLGVVEHFEPSVTIDLMREQARCAPLVLAAVPTRFTRYAGSLSDERLYTRRRFTELVAQSGLRVRESFVYGEVPTRTARNLERALPGAVYRRLKHACSYGMGICCVGERSHRPR